MLFQMSRLRATLTLSRVVRSGADEGGSRSHEISWRELVKWFVSTEACLFSRRLSTTDEEITIRDA